MAAILRETARDIDLVGRLDGEEVGGVLPETSGPDGYEVAERMRAAVGSSAQDGEIEVTASFGVAVQHPGRDLVTAADAALYEAKAGGRNQSVLDPS